MRIGVPAETRPGETRVAATAETVKKLVAAGHQVVVEAGAGLAASQTDDAYASAGATIGTAADALGADMVLKVRAPSAAELPSMRRGAALIGMLDPFDRDGLQRLTDAIHQALPPGTTPRTAVAAAGSPVDLDLLAEQLHRGDPGARAALEQQAAALQAALGVAATEQLRRQVAAFDFDAALRTLRHARSASRHRHDP